MKKIFLIKTLLVFFLLSFSFQPFAQTGQSLNFDGVDDYITLPFVVSGSYTKELWIKPDNTAGFPNILSGSSTALYLNNMSLAAGHSPSFNQVIDPTPLTAGTWIHIAVTYDAATGDMKLYRNGVQVDAQTAPAYTETNMELGRFIFSNFYSGNMDEVRVWSVVRTQAEIAAGMNCRLTDDTPGLLAYYDFQQGIAGGNNATETMLRDRASFCNPQDGMLMNFSLTGTTSNWVADGISLSGYCNASPNIHVTGNSDCIVSGDISPVLTDGTDFGNFYATPISNTFVINNTGSDVLNISSIISSSTDFTISGAPATIAAGSSATFTVTFSPTAPLGVKTATITVNSNDANDGTYTFSVTGEFRSIGQSLDFDGIDDYVSLPLIVSGSYTKEAWIKPDAQGGFPNLISGTGTAFYLNNMQLAAGHSGSGFTEVLDPIALNAGQWYHIAVTYDAGSGIMNLYKDNALVSSSVAVPYTETILELGRFNFSNYYAGNMDEVRIWNYARTQAEIAATMNCQINDDLPGLLAYYDFNQGAANGNNFTELTLLDRHDTCVAQNGTLFNFANSGNNSNWVSDTPFPAGTYCGPLRSNIRLSGFGECILDGDLTPSVTNGTDFGFYTSGNPVFRTYVIKNTGSDTLTLGVPVISGPDAVHFQITSFPATSVAPGDSTSFTVQFIATTLGVKNAIITIANNDADEASYTFAIRGERQQPLPVNLISFNGMLVEKEVKLSWSTTSERNNRGFEILRSDASQRKWISIGFVSAQNLQMANYTFLDYTPLAGINTYRLKQVDLDGNSSLSNIVSVNVNIKTAVVKTFPNPFTSTITVSFNDKILLNSIAILRNATGITVGKYILSDYRTSINLQNMSKGMYILSLSNGEVIKLIKQ